MAVNLTNISVSSLNFADFSIIEYLKTIKPLIIFVAGIVVYSLFIFKFYKFLAKRDILELELHKYSEGFAGFIKRIAHVLLYTLENLVITPLLVFFWFAVLTLLLLLLSKTHSLDSLLLVSAALVASVRVTSYYHEALSQDLAKMVPFALLAVFISEAVFFSVQDTASILKQIPSFIVPLLYYLVFIIVVEVVMRIIQTLTYFAGSSKRQAEK